MKLRENISGFLRQPLFIRLWSLPLWFILGTAKIIIFKISFKKFGPWLGCVAGINPWVPLLTSDQEARALNIGRAVRITAQYTPWDSNCFPQAIAARLLLGLYGIPYVMYFGLMRDPTSGDMKAHAWVCAGSIRVTGGYSFNDFKVVGCFASKTLQGVIEP